MIGLVIGRAFNPVTVSAKVAAAEEFGVDLDKVLSAWRSRSNFISPLFGWRVIGPDEKGRDMGKPCGKEREESRGQRCPRLVFEAGDGRGQLEDDDQELQAVDVDVVGVAGVELDSAPDVGAPIDCQPEPERG